MPLFVSTFEDDSDWREWSYENGAARSTITAAEGTTSARLPMLSSPAGFVVPGTISRPLTLTVGTTYDVSMMVNGEASLGQPLIVEIDAGDGMSVELGSMQTSAPWTLWEVGTFTAVGTAGVIKIRNGSSERGHVWFVDEIVLEEIEVGVEVSTRGEVYEAFKATLSTIIEGQIPDDPTNAGSEPFAAFENTVPAASVYETLPDVGTVRMPAICISEVRFGVDVHTLGRRKTLAHFVVECWHDSLAKAINLSADVVKAMFAAGITDGIGQLGLSRTRCIDVQAPDDEAMIASPEATQGRRMVRQPIAVTFIHPRGNP